MNKYDIEELQAFLQGEYIGESTSRSLKEVKQHQQKQNEITSKNKLTEIRKFLRKYLSKKTIRQLEQYQLRINKKDLHTDKERELYDIVCKDLRSCENDTTLAKTKICNYLGIDKNMFELMQPGWDIRESVSDRLINLTFKKIYGYERRITYSGIRFIHLTKYRKLTSLKPSTRNTAMSRVYAEPCVFFFAVKASTIDEAIKKLLSSDDYIEIVPGSTSCVYEYIPRGNAEVFLDSGHMTNKQMKNADFKEVTPVFIKTRSSLPVKDVTSIYRKISAELDNEDDRDYISESYETAYKPYKQLAAEEESDMTLNKQRLKSMHNYPAFESYIDETIERFDAFMEEFNNEQIGDSEFIMESAQDDKYAKITQDYIKKSGRSYFRYKKGEDTLPPEVEARIFDLAHKIIDFNDKGNFNQYKAYYDAFCKLVHHPNNTCIMGASINNIDDGYINLGILSNRKTAQRCPLKPGMHVYTTSNNPTLTTLDPYHFKGEPNSIRKTRSKNKMPGNDTYYAFPRAYFYVESFGSRYGGNTSKIQYDAKGIPIINNSDKGYGHLYMYTVKAGDQFYFDPELNDTGIIGRAVFMFVKKPVKLIKIY